MASAAFVCLASVRDVYVGGLFQRLSPLDVASALAWISFFFALGATEPLMVQIRQAPPGRFRAWGGWGSISWPARA